MSAFPKQALHLVLSLTAISASPVVAQQAQQTPENAQRFLASVWPAEWSMTWPGLNVPLNVVRTSAVTSADACQSSYTTRYPDGSVGSSGMDWRALAQVRQEGSQVITTRLADGLSQAFNFRAEALAARAAFAMEFLRQHCDPAAGTGF